MRRDTENGLAPEKKEPGNPYALISGLGRSGSNRILDILDTSDITSCRNEANEVCGSEFYGIGGELFPAELEECHIRKLQEAISRSNLRRSRRDRLTLREKSYANILARQFSVLTSKSKIRRGLRLARIISNEHEWDLPPWTLNKDISYTAVPVLKLNSCPAWATGLVNTDRNCYIVHNIRDPFDYLQSWYNRFIINRAGFRSFQSNFSDIPKILEYFDRDDAERLKEPTLENLVEVEIWRWRYVNELLFSASSSERYMQIHYSDVENRPVEEAAKMFCFLSIPFGSAERLRVGSLKNKLFQNPHASKLEKGLCEKLLDRVLEESPLFPN